MPKKQVVKKLEKLDRMDVVDMDIMTPKPNFYNPNRQSDREFELLCRSIEEDGYCVSSDTPVLCADLIWRPAGKLEVGNLLVAFEEEVPSFGERHFKTSIVTSNELLPDILFHVTTAKGDVRCNKEHPWLVSRNAKSFEWVPTHALNKGDKVIFLDVAAAGWEELPISQFSTLSEILSIEPDGEGEIASLSTSTQTYIAGGFAMHNTQPIITVKISQAHLDAEPKLAGNDFKLDDLMIVDGEHRWRACRALGHTTIQAIITNMTIEQVMVATLRHNRARGNENIDLAAQVLKQLNDYGTIDWAQDSLMMDAVELRIMLEDIPDAELYLRESDTPLTAPIIEQMVRDERAAELQVKRDENEQYGLDKRSIYALGAEFTPAERAVVMKVLLGFGKQTPGENLIALLQKYQNDPSAIEILQASY